MRDQLRYLIPADVAEAPLWVRIEWLLSDMRRDDLMSGVPRYEHRYTEREHQLASYLRAAMEHRSDSHGHIAYPVEDAPLSGRCSICGQKMAASHTPGAGNTNDGNNTG